VRVARCCSRVASLRYHTESFCYFQKRDANRDADNGAHSKRQDHIISATCITGLECTDGGALTLPPPPPPGPAPPPCNPTKAVASLANGSLLAPLPLRATYPPAPPAPVPGPSPTIRLPPPAVAAAETPRAPLCFALLAAPILCLPSCAISLSDSCHSQICQPSSHTTLSKSNRKHADTDLQPFLILGERLHDVFEVAVPALGPPRAPPMPDPF
jgi:hypothetical protein